LLEGFGLHWFAGLVQATMALIKTGRFFKQKKAAEDKNKKKILPRRYEGHEEERR